MVAAMPLSSQRTGRRNRAQQNQGETTKERDKRCTKLFHLDFRATLLENSATHSKEGSVQTTVFADKEFPNDWHVEMIDSETGDIYQTVFSGPDAEGRAREYAEWEASKKHRIRQAA